MRNTILNFARGSWYPKGQRRLASSLDDTGYTGDRLFLGKEADAGSPPHEGSPYAFKPAMFASAKKKGNKIALWCDASVFAIKSITPVLDYIEEHGHLFFSNGIVGSWSSDAALASFGVDRDTAMGITEIMGCCMGFNLDHPRSQEFLRVWEEKSLDGKTFPGSWTNDEQQVSRDPRVRGHRHDQTAASLIAWQLGMDRLIAHDTFLQYYENPDGTPYHYGQENDMSRIFPSVCLLNNGM